MLQVDGQDSEEQGAGTPRRLPQMHVRVGRWSPDPVLVVAGEIDRKTSPALQSALDVLNGRVIVDLYGVSFMDSSGIGVLATAQRRLSAAGGTLRLRSPQEHVRRSLELLGMSDWVIGVRALPTAEQRLRSSQTATDPSTA